METTELLIIGAGLRGIAMAKTYHGVNPKAEMIIMDGSKTVGGVWAKERLYPGLRANNPLGFYEYSDLPMTPEIAGCQPFQPIPGPGIQRYMEEAVKVFDVEKFLRLGCKVHSARLLDDDCWEIKYSSSEDEKAVKRLKARKIVVSTGVASEPYVPHIPGQEQYRGLLLHSKQFSDRAKEVAKAKTVVVLGGNKSACDVVYQAAQSGSVAHMVLRRTGGGPSYQWNGLYNIFGRKSPMAVFTFTRLFTLFDPWPFSKSWIRDFLHKWGLGLQITKAFWRRLSSEYVKKLSAGEHTEKLTPWQSTYWMGPGHSASLNYPTDWYQLVREGRIVIHHAEVQALSQTGVKLTDSIIEDVDAVVCCTGWKQIPPIEFLPAGLDLGLDSLPEEFGNEQALVHQARKTILRQRPFLATAVRDQTISTDPDAKRPDATPCRLYRYMVPPTSKFLTSRNLAFNAIDNFLLAPAAAQIQALWITAFLDNNIPHLHPGNLNMDQVHRDTILMSEYQRLRHPKVAGGTGERHGEFLFDGLPAMDVLFEDLGMQPKRKPTTLREWLEPYFPADHTGLVGEYLSLKRNQSRQTV